jgi:hypothetical protein
MWADEWDLDAQVIALIQNQHHFHEVSRLDRFMTTRRFPSRSSGFDTPESWAYDCGTGVVKRWETLVDLTTDERTMRQRLGSRAIAGNPPTLWRGDAVRKHYLFEDLATAMQFKITWCTGR